MLLSIYNNSLSAMGVSYSVVSAFDQKKDLETIPAGTIMLEFDTIDECTTGGSATVTKYPTEMGAYATDYKYKNPDTVSMVGIIAEGGLIGRSSMFRRMGRWDRKSAIEAIRKNLDDMISTMKLVNIQTRNAGRRDYMTLTAYEINETYDTYGTMQVTMQFQQVPQFDASGKLCRNASDTDTEKTGITATQAIGAIAAATLVIGSAAAGNAAAWS